MIHHEKGILKDSLTFMQYFKLVNWRICGFVFWCHEQVKSLIFVKSKNRYYYFDLWKICLTLQQAFVYIFEE